MKTLLSKWVGNCVLKMLSCCSSQYSKWSLNPSGEVSTGRRIPMEDQKPEMLSRWQNGNIWQGACQHVWLWAVAFSRANWTDFVSESDWEQLVEGGCPESHWGDMGSGLVLKSHLFLLFAMRSCIRKGWYKWNHRSPWMSLLWFLFLLVVEVVLYLL